MTLYVILGRMKSGEQKALVAEDDLTVAINRMAAWIERRTKYEVGSDKGALGCNSYDMYFIERVEYYPTRTPGRVDEPSERIPD